MTVYNKLVRDKIPEMIRRQGETPHTRILDQDDAPEKLWYAYDGQALYLYYGTPEQEALLENKTGYIWLDPVNNPLYSE